MASHTRAAPRGFWAAFVFWSGVRERPCCVLGPCSNGRMCLSLRRANHSPRTSGAFARFTSEMPASDRNAPFLKDVPREIAEHRKQWPLGSCLFVRFHGARLVFFFVLAGLSRNVSFSPGRFPQTWRPGDIAERRTRWSPNSGLLRVNPLVRRCRLQFRTALNCQVHRATTQACHSH